MAGLLLAHATYRGSLSALAPAAAFLAVIDVYQARIEEAALRGRFEEPYNKYCAAVPRWLDARSVRAVSACAEA